MRAFIFLAVLAAIIFQATERDAPRALEARTARPALFWLREALGRAPQLDPRLKIYAYDDEAVARRRTEGLSPRDWVTVLTAIAAKEPAAIYADELFALPPDAPAADVEALAAVAAKVKLVTATQLTPKPVQFHAPLKVEGGPAPYQLASYFPAPSALSMLREGFLPYGVLGQTAFAYGPDPRLATALTRAGHAMPGENGRVPALLGLAPGLVMPHFTLMGARSLRLRGKSLVIDSEREVPLAKDGLVELDLPPVRVLNATPKSLEPLFDPGASAGVDAGDVVLILPSLHSGGAEPVATPAGKVAPALLSAVLLNSALRGEWLTPLRGGTALALAAYALGAALPELLYAALALALWLAAAAGLFLLANVLPDVCAPALALCVGAGAGATLRRLGALKKSRRAAAAAAKARADAVAVKSSAVPALTGLDLGARSAAGAGVATAWHAFEVSASGRYLHVLLFDVTAPEAEVAVAASATRTVLAMLARESPAALEGDKFLSQLAQALNDTLFAQGQGKRTTSLCGVTLDRTTGGCVYLCAGHASPLLLRTQPRAGKSAVELLLSSHPQLGAAPRLAVHLGATPLFAGDRVVLTAGEVKLPADPRALEPLLRTLAAASAESAALALLGELVPDADAAATVLWIACRYDWGTRRSA